MTTEYWLDVPDDIATQNKKQTSQKWHRIRAYSKQKEMTFYGVNVVVVVDVDFTCYGHYPCLIRKFL